MTAYQRDDGAEMVEYKPGRTIRRDHGIRLGLIAPEFGIGRARPAALAPAADPQPEPVAPPPLQPSHEDLLSIAPAPATAARRLLDDDDQARRTQVLVAATVTGDELAVLPAALPAARASKPRPAKRSLAAILAEADRTHRTLRRKGRP